MTQNGDMPHFRQEMGTCLISRGGPAHRFAILDALVATTLTALLMSGPAVGAADEGARPGVPRLALVIDDVGHSPEQVERVLALPGPVTLGVLPHTPAAKLAARRGAGHGKEIILHQPMQNLAGLPLGPDGLYADLGRSQFLARLDAALAAVPGSRGVSNHTGSLLTQTQQPMDWLMDALAARHLFFLDSRTTARSIAATIALRHGVRTISRDVFLDNDLRAESIEQALQHALAIARHRGYAVVIGHPHRVTLAVLEQRLPALPAMGIEPVLLSELLRPEAGTIAAQ